MQLKYSLLILLLLPVCTFGQELPKFKVNARQILSATAGQKEDMIEALATFEKVMNDKDFQKELLEKKFYFHLTKDPNHKLTTKEIVTKLYDGKESYQSDIDHEADIYWQVYDELKCTTVGSGFPRRPMIYTRPCLINGGDIAAMAGHIAHEWTHKFGFIDGNYNGRRRKEMVSYAFGYLVTKHSAKYV